ncbi:mRNA splicing protein, partial [Ceratobasidium sp. 395]
VGILAKYGGEEYLEKAPKELLAGQTEDYVEYSRTGKVIKGRERAKAKSKYDEDVFVNNHTAIWGSWYSISSGQWGFGCCHSTLRGSYCSGEAGIEAAEAASAKKLLNPPRTLLETHAESAKGKEKAKGNAADDSNPFKQQLGETNVNLDRQKLQQALAEEKKRKKGEFDDDTGDKRRKFNTSAGNHDVTEEELEAYRMQRSNYEDPMANYKDTEI